MTFAERVPGVTIEEHPESNNNNEREEPGQDSGSDATQARAPARARTRARITLTDDHRQLIHLWASEARNTFRRLSGWLEGNAFLREHPSSLSSRLAYAREAPMAGHSRVLRWVQRLDSYLIGIPAAQLLDAARWLVERPLRRWTTVAIVLLIWRLH